MFVDIDPQTYTIDPDEVARAITPRTRAIVPVHLHGMLPADMDAIRALAQQHRALSSSRMQRKQHGATYRGKA